MNIPRTLAGYKLVNEFLCTDCINPKEAREAGLDSVRHDGTRRFCSACGELFSGPFLGSELYTGAFRNVEHD